MAGVDESEGVVSLRRSLIASPVGEPKFPSPLLLLFPFRFFRSLALSFVEALLLDAFGEEVDCIGQPSCKGDISTYGVTVALS